MVYTQDTHFEDDAVEFPIWGPHVVKGTWGWEIVEELKPTKGDVVIEKMRYDAFFRNSYGPRVENVWDSTLSGRGDSG